MKDELKIYINNLKEEIEKLSLEEKAIHEKNLRLQVVVLELEAIINKGEE